MNAKIVLLVAVLAGGSQALAADERVTLAQTPPAVQAAIKSAQIANPIKEITRRTRDGRTTYEVEFERNNAPNPHLRIEEDGKVVQPMPLAPATETMWPITAEYPDITALRPTLKLSDLPAPVQAAVRAHARGREVGDVDGERWNGSVVYEVEFKEPGLNPQIHVAEDGTVVRDERERRGLKSLFLGTQLEDTPFAVQETIRRVGGDREIVDIDRRGPLNRSVYLVEVRNTNGLETLHIAEDGKLLEGSREGTPPARK